MAKSDPGNDQNDADARRKHWVKAAITLLLIAIVILSGSAMIYTRQQWWEMYMRLTH